MSNIFDINLFQSALDKILLVLTREKEMIDNKLFNSDLEKLTRDKNCLLQYFEWQKENFAKYMKELDNQDIRASLAQKLMDMEKLAIQNEARLMHRYQKSHKILEFIQKDVNNSYADQYGKKRTNGSSLVLDKTT